MSISHPPWQVLKVRPRPNTGWNLEAQRSVERSCCAAAASVRALAGPLPCDVQRPSVSVAPRLTVTADTARLSGAHQAAARPKIDGTAGSPGETPAMSGPLAAGRSARVGGPRALGDASRARVRCCPGAPGSPRVTASPRQSAVRASWLRDPRPQYLLLN